MTELEEKLLTLVDALLENQPRQTSEKWDVGAPYTLVASTQYTFTFVMDTDKYVMRLIEAAVDARTGLTFKWIVNGKIVTENPAWEPPYGIGVNDDIKLIVANTTLANLDVFYRIRGWGDLKSGG